MKVKEFLFRWSQNSDDLNIFWKKNYIAQMQLRFHADIHFTSILAWPKIQPEYFEQNPVLEPRMIALVIALPYFHSLWYDSLKDGEKWKFWTRKIFGSDLDFDRVFKVHLILLDWFVW